MKSRVIIGLVLSTGLVFSEQCRADVVVLTSGSDVIIAPDYSRNWWGPHDIEIVPVSNNSGFFVVGQDGTRVNGNSLRFAAFPQDDLRIELPYGGKHEVRIRDFTAPGWDDIRVSGYLFVGLNNVHINRNWHSDFVMDGDQFGAINCSFRRDLDVQAYDGAELSTVTVGRHADLPSAQLNETVTIGGDLSIYEDGTEQFRTSLTSVTVGGELYYRGSGWNDEVTFQGVSTGRLRIFLGYGDDFVEFRNTTVGVSVYVDGGPGDDSAGNLGGNNFTINSNNSDNMEF